LFKRSADKLRYRYCKTDLYEPQRISALDGPYFSHVIKFKIHSWLAAYLTMQYHIQNLFIFQWCEKLIAYVQEMNVGGRNPVCIKTTKQKLLTDTEINN
jgi:hypothetical protein